MDKKKYFSGIIDQLKAERDEYLESCRLWESKCSNMMELPRDADGEPWHINDEFEIDEGIVHVNGIGDNRLFYIDNDGMQWTRADNKLHYHAPTVEDVLREFAEKITDSQIPGVHPTYEESIAEYATKLRLAGDAE